MIYKWLACLTNLKKGACSKKSQNIKHVSLLSHPFSTELLKCERIQERKDGREKGRKEGREELRK